MHEESYRVEFPPGGEPTFYDPRGLPLPDSPPPVRAAMRPVEWLIRENRRRGVVPGYRTGMARYKREADIPWPVMARALEALD